MTDLDKMAREMLAQWHLDRGLGEKVARDCRSGVINIPDIYWDLIRAALLTAPPGWKLVPEMPGNEPAPVAIVVEQDTAYSAYPYGIKKLRNAAHLRTGTLLYAAPQPAPAIDLAQGLRDLYRAYVRLLESGKDRITSLGGDCDPVDVMEQTDIDLRKVRDLLALIDGQKGTQS